MRSLRIQLSLVRFCLICGQSYGGLLSASLNHILSSPCFRERSEKVCCAECMTSCAQQVKKINVAPASSPYSRYGKGDIPIRGIFMLLKFRYVLDIIVLPDIRRF